MSWRRWTLTCACVVLLVQSASSAPRSDPAVQAGRALYLTHCAACHGPEGRGDGPSAGGLATKPANLTEGRLLEHVPDEFLHSLVRGGGAAEGLAPTMPAFGAYLGDVQIREVVAYVRTLARPEARTRPPAPAVVTVPGAPKQPIFFSHLIHAGKYQIDCQYCHANARRGPSAGLPSVERCLGCHKVIGALDNPEIGKIAGYASRGESIPWVRVFKLPEYVYFAHKPHIRAGVACQSCHGSIERMRVVGGVTGQGLLNDLANVVGLRPAPRPLTMGWCVDCHREQNRARGTAAPLDCVVCHH